MRGEVSNFPVATSAIAISYDHPLTASSREYSGRRREREN